VQFVIEMCLLQPKIAKKSIKTPYFGIQGIQGQFGGNREPVYDFLLVINSNVGPSQSRTEKVGNSTSLSRPFPFLPFRSRTHKWTRKFGENGIKFL